MPTLPAPPAAVPPPLAERRPLAPLICPPLLARRSWCRLAAGIVARGRAGAGDGRCELAPALLSRPIADPELLLCSPSGSWGITAQGTLTGTRRPHPAMAAQAAHLLQRTATALTLLAGHASRHLRSAEEASGPAQRIWRLGGCLVAWDEVLPGWGRWGAAAVALELATQTAVPERLRVSLRAQAGRDAAVAGTLLDLASPGGIASDMPSAAEAARRCQQAWNGVTAWLVRMRAAWASALADAPSAGHGTQRP